MKLDEAQSQKVAAWINEGCKLSEIQNRLAKEFGLHMTYLDARLLVDELNLRPKDPPAAQPATPAPAPAPAAPAATPDPTAPAASQSAGDEELPVEPEGAPATGGVSVTVDQIARPGAMLSGQVTFSDGKSTNWFLDQRGGIGLEKGCRPSQSDLRLFQIELQEQLQKLGYI
jgi:hypothetical protein